MSVRDSALDPGALAFARGLLLPPIRRETLWSPLLAAAFAAVCALSLAFAVLTAPPVMSEHTAPQVTRAGK